MKRILFSFLAIVFACMANAQVGCPKIDQCFVFTYKGFSINATAGTVTLTFCIQTNCEYDLSYAAFGLPDGATALSPSNSASYTSSGGFKYNVENPTELPFHCIKFDAAGSIYYKNGISDCFTYTVSKDVFANMATINIEAKAGQIIGDAKFSVKATGSCASLPVNFSSFTATRKNKGIALTWETASELNNKGFYIERTINEDGWKEIGFIPSAAGEGNSSQPLSYTFNDLNPVAGLIQYRLKQVDINNSVKYSEIRTVTAEKQNNSITVYPNPSSDGVVNVAFANQAMRDVFVSDAVGRIVKQYRNITNTNLVIEKLTVGFYIIKVVNHSDESTTIQNVIVK